MPPSAEPDGAVGAVDDWIAATGLGTEGLEVAVTISVANIDELLAQPRDGASPEDRLIELVEAFNRYVAANEALYRTAQRHYLDTWLAAERGGEGHEQPVREGRRREWISAVLEPRRATMASAESQRLEAALCLVFGGEAFTVMPDVCHLDADEATAVQVWAASAILGAGVPT